MTASMPERAPPLPRTTGTPPPPEQITQMPSSSMSRMAAMGTISTGSGLGTTRRQPRPASSFMARPSSSIIFLATASL